MANHELTQWIDAGDALNAERAEAWAVGQRAGEDVPQTDPAWHNNAKWHAGQAEGHAEDAEAWAEGTRNGAAVGTTDPAYHHNAAYHAGEAAGSAEAAGRSAGAAAGSAGDAEAWAEGTRGGTPVGSGDPAYHHDAKYHAGEAAGSAEAASGSAGAAAGSAEAASGSAGAASGSALKAEGYAIGKQNGTDVGSGSPYYQHNAAYHAGQAAGSAEAASGSAGAASASALKAEGWAEGKQNGQDVGSGSPYYHHDAKYHAQQAASSAEAAAASAGAIHDATAEATTLEPNQPATAQVVPMAGGLKFVLGIPRGMSGNDDIDDTAGIGNTDKVWSANKVASEIKNFMDALEKIGLTVVDGQFFIQPVESI